MTLLSNKLFTKKQYSIMQNNTFVTSFNNENGRA